MQRFLVFILTLSLATIGQCSSLKNPVQNTSSEEDENAKGPVRVLNSGGSNLFKLTSKHPLFQYVSLVQNNSSLGGKSEPSVAEIFDELPSTSVLNNYPASQLSLPWINLFPSAKSKDFNLQLMKTVMASLAGRTFVAPSGKFVVSFNESTYTKIIDEIYKETTPRTETSKTTRPDSSAGYETTPTLSTPTETTGKPSPLEKVLDDLLPWLASLNLENIQTEVTTDSLVAKTINKRSVNDTPSTSFPLEKNSPMTSPNLTTAEDSQLTVNLTQSHPFSDVYGSDPISNLLTATTTARGPIPGKKSNNSFAIYGNSAVILSSLFVIALISKIFQF